MSLVWTGPPPAYYSPPSETHCDECAGCPLEAPVDCDYCPHDYHADAACRARIGHVNRIVGQALEPCECEGSVQIRKCEGPHAICRHHAEQYDLDITIERDERKEER